MRNGKEVNVWERLFKLWAMICKMIMDEVRDPEKVAEVLQSIVTVKIYLRRIFEKETIKLGDKAFAVYEMIEDGTFSQLFWSLGKPDQLYFESLEQVDVFCLKHYDKLIKDGSTNFFLFRKRKEKEFLVACFSVLLNNNPFNGVHPLKWGRIWHAGFRHRLVIPILEQ